MPAPSTVFLWLREHVEFSEQYARAKEEAADMFIEDILEIADNSKKDRIPVYEVNEAGEKVLTGYKESKNSVRRAQVQIESRKWLAVKLKPKKYGDRLAVDGKQEHSGNLNVNHSLADLTDEELILAAQAAVENAKKGLKDGK